MSSNILILLMGSGLKCMIVSIVKNQLHLQVVVL